MLRVTVLPLISLMSALPSAGLAQAPRVQVIPGPGGSATVLLRTCTADYFNTGQRRSATSGCTATDLRTADEAMVRYRREQGLGGPPFPRPLPPGALIGRPAPYLDLVGSRRDFAEREMARRGFAQTSSVQTEDRGRLSLYWRTPSRQCVSLNTRDGRVHRARSLPPARCLSR